MIKQILSNTIAKNKALLLHEADKINDFMRLLMKHRNRIPGIHGQRKKEKYCGRTCGIFLPTSRRLSFFASPVVPSCFLCLLKYSIEEKTNRASAKQDPKGKGDNHLTSES